VQNIGKTQHGSWDHHEKILLHVPSRALHLVSYLLLVRLASLSPEAQRWGGWGRVGGIASSHHLRRGDPGPPTVGLCDDPGRDLDGYSRLNGRRR
jgi:hypothetical protein